MLFNFVLRFCFVYLCLYACFVSISAWLIRNLIIPYNQEYNESTGKKQTNDRENISITTNERKWDQYKFRYYVFAIPHTHAHRNLIRIYNSIFVYTVLSSAPIVHKKAATKTLPTTAMRNVIMYVIWVSVSLLITLVFFSVRRSPPIAMKAIPKKSTSKITSSFNKNMQTASHTVVKPEITPHNRMLHMCLKK